MFVVTNREVLTRRKGLEQLGKTPNKKGPNELRVLEVVKKRGGSWDVESLPDRQSLPKASRVALGLKAGEQAYASHRVAIELFGRLRKEGKNLLFYVHGFNNDVETALERAHLLEKEYGVEVLLFSWPANGGGVQGALSYKKDKMDARASAGALDRTLDKMKNLLENLRDDSLFQLRREAKVRFPLDLEEREKFLAKAANDQCPFRVSLLLHSMGNYLYKQVMKSSLSAGHELLFDNLVLVAADTNNKDHEQWVDKVQVRNRIYITINENDYALRFSRMKGGHDQKARLGHYPFRLNSSKAVYVDFTVAKSVGKSHAYFEGDAIKNASVKKFFTLVFRGETAESEVGEFNEAKRFWVIE